jgi:hypothetical protein
MAVPGRFRRGKLELLGKACGHSETARAERSQRAGGAAELHDQSALAQPQQPVSGAL